MTVPPRVWAAIGNLCCLLALWLSGCTPASTTPPPVESTSLTADEVWERMVSAYKKAETYQDQAMVRLRYKVDGQSQEDPATLSVRWKRPNRLKLNAYQLTIQSDGKRWIANLRDKATNDLDQQVVVRDLETAMSREDLVRDPVIHDVLSGGLGGFPVSLELLLGEEPLQAAIGEGAIRELLSSDSFDGHSCYRVQVPGVDGPFVFWIDRETSTLRRLDYPTSRLEGQMSATPGVSDVSLTAEFTAARLNEPIADSEFKVAIPSSSKQVAAFVLPPQPLPTPLYGTRPDYFSFTGLDQKKLRRDDLAGKYAVLMWFNDHPDCWASLKQLESLRSQLDQSDQVTFVAVNTDKPEALSDRQLAAALEQHGIQMVAARDLDAAGRDIFQIPYAPALVVLDPEGKLQVYQIGANPNLRADLNEQLGELLAGQDLAAALVTRYRAEKENYRRLLAGGGAPQSELIEVAETPLAPASLPQRLKRTQVWQSDTLLAAGNLLVIDSPTDPEATEVLVHQGFRRIARLSSQGELKQQIDLTLPDKAAVSYLRTATDKPGRRYYAAASLRGRQVHVFDQEWKPLFSYPPIEQTHDGIGDVQWFDLDNDGTPELYIGFWGLVGVHGVDLEGKRKWINRRATNVLSLSESQPNSVGWRQVLASGDLGPIVAINRFGNHDPPQTVTGRSIHHLFQGGWDSAKTAPFCGLTYQNDGRLLALGLSADLQESWSYRLPAGTFRVELQLATSGQLLSDDSMEWLFAGPNGTVHLVREDGEFFDRFALGEYLSGMAVLQLPQQRLLLISSGDKVTAYTFSEK